MINQEENMTDLVQTHRDDLLDIFCAKLAQDPS